MNTFTTNEHGGIVSGWIIKLLIWLALAGLLLFEAGAVVVASVGADNAARDAAQEAVATYANGHDLQAAKRAAETKAGQEGAIVIAFSADANGAGGQSRVTVTVQRTAKTLFIHRISFLKRFTKEKATSTVYST